MDPNFYIFVCLFDTIIASIGDRSDHNRFLSMFPESNQFECVKDRVCIEVSYRCDGVHHCVDATDEMDCPNSPATTVSHLPRASRSYNSLAPNETHLLCMNFSRGFRGDRIMKQNSFSPCVLALLSFLEYGVGP